MSALIAALLLQTTTCTTNLGITTCNTSPPPPSTGFSWDRALEAQRAEDARATEGRRQSAEASAERRARAYAQVGELIAAGKCVEAKRLAQFYDKPDIIKDTARACP